MNQVQKLLLDSLFIFWKIFNRIFERISRKRNYRSVVFKTGKIAVKFVNQPANVVDSLTLNNVANAVCLTYFFLTLEMPLHSDQFVLSFSRVQALR